MLEQAFIMPDTFARSDGIIIVVVEVGFGLDPAAEESLPQPAAQDHKVHYRKRRERGELPRQRERRTERKSAKADGRGRKPEEKDDETRRKQLHQHQERAEVQPQPSTAKHVCITCLSRLAPPRRPRARPRGGWGWAY